MDLETRRSLSMAGLAAFLRVQAPFHLLTEMPGNTGDRLIWAGTQELFEDEGLAWTAVPVPEVAAGGRVSGTLVVPGSGAMSRAWHEWLPQTVLAASQRFDRVVILPSSFDPEVPVVARCLSRPNVFAFAREANSYRAIRAFGRAALCLDCAFCAVRAVANATAGTRAPEAGSVLLALREDVSSALADHGLQAAPMLNTDISSRIMDLEEWLCAIAGAEGVVTDRLHVVVAALLLGRRVDCVEPREGKISTYMAFALRAEFADKVRMRTLEWLKAQGYALEFEEVT